MKRRLRSPPEKGRARDGVARARPSFYATPRRKLSISVPGRLSLEGHNYIHRLRRRDKRVGDIELSAARRPGANHGLSRHLGINLKVLRIVNFARLQFPGRAKYSGEILRRRVNSQIPHAILRTFGDCDGELHSR